MKYQYGHFNSEGTEFTITDPKTPRAFDNFLWNDALFSAVQQTGVGYLDYQVDGKEAVKLLTGIGRICDFDVFGREGLMSRLIYVRDNESGKFWNVNWEPVKCEFEFFECTHGLGYSRISSKVDGISSSFRIFVPKGKDPLELWTLEFKNESGRSRDLSVFVYNQFIFTYKWGFNSYGDMLFRNSFFNHEANAMVATKHPHISPHNYQTAFMTSYEPITGYDGSRDSFVGAYNALNEPECVIGGKCSNSEGSSDSTIGVTQFDLQLANGEKKKIDMLLGVSDSEKGIAPMKEKYLRDIEAHFEYLQKSNMEFVMQNHVKTPDEHFNRMTNIWLKHQTSFGAKWCRWGWMGYRDIVQHGYGVSSFNPARTREILLEAFAHQYSNGMALRGWNPVDEKQYSDSALWLVFTLVSYLKESADFQLLDVDVKYYDEGSGSVLEHIERALNFLEDHKGAHGLCLIKFGDWNDSLTGIGKEGRGESVWLSMAYAEAVRQMQGLSHYLNKKTMSEGYAKKYSAIKQAINDNAWDGKWYVRCFDDNGRAIGSDINEQGKIFANTQSWSMISQIACKERVETVLESSNKLLRTEIGYLLLAPTFHEFDPHIGRISCLEPGICENGTVYSHINAWMVLGLLRSGKADEAYDTFRRISPGYVSGKPNDPKQNMPPYIFANGYFGPDHRNNKFQMEFTWITGSVAWHYNNLTKEMIGVQPDYDGLVLDPHLPGEWNEVSVSRSYQGKHFDISIVRGEGDAMELQLNGVHYPGNKIYLDDCADQNSVLVLIP